MPTTITDKGRETRQRIVRTAAELFRRQGYDGTGLSEVLQRSGAPRGSLYFHFPGGKRELALAAVAEAGIEIGRGFELLLAASEDVGEAIGGVVEMLAADLERSRYRGGCPIAAVTHDTAARSEEIRSACHAAFEHWHGLLEARLRRAGRSPESAREEAFLILAAIEGGITLARAHRDSEPLRAVARRLRAIGAS